jgi:hypothetical protein
MKAEMASELLVEFYSIQYDDDHVDGARLRLWTAATNGPITHPQVMYEHERTMVE